MHNVKTVMIMELHLALIFVNATHDLSTDLNTQQFKLRSEHIDNNKLSLSGAK